MNTIEMSTLVGTFAENKDIARRTRIETIVPLLENQEEVMLDFQGVDSATQSFIHALISDPLRRYGSEVLDNILFKNCSENIKKIIEMVVDYMQESE